MTFIYVHVYVQIGIHYVHVCICIIGASLSEPHTSEVAEKFASYTYIFVSLFVFVRIP